MSGRSAGPLDFIMRMGAGAAVLALACPAQAGARDEVEPVSSDLRVFFDDRCLPENEQTEAVQKQTKATLSPGGGPAAVVTELILGFGALAIKTFGDALVDAGSPRIDRAHAVAGSMFYLFPEQDDEGAQAQSVASKSIMNPEARCVHIVRDGFSRKAAKSDADPLGRAPAAMKKFWTELGFRSTPSLYVQLRLETPPDHEKFRATPVFAYANRFLRSGKAERDFLLSLSFLAPGDQRAPGVSSAGEELSYVEGRNAPFAVGALQFIGLERGALLESGDLRGLETGWMPLPAAGSLSANGAFNLEADLVELKHGDPLLVEIGGLLGSDKVMEAARQDMQNAMQRSSR